MIPNEPEGADSTFFSRLNLFPAHAIIIIMVSYDDMTPDERDRLIYLVLREVDLKAIVLIMKKRFGPDVSTDRIMRFAFKVAVGRMTPAHLKKKKK